VNVPVVSSSTLDATLNEPADTSYTLEYTDGSGDALNVYLGVTKTRALAGIPETVTVVIVTPVSLTVTPVCKP
jgi:hypothetical protein